MANLRQQLAETIIKMPAIVRPQVEGIVSKLMEHFERTPGARYELDPKKITTPMFGAADPELTKLLVPQTSVRSQLPPYPDPGKAFPRRDRIRGIHENVDAIAENIVQRLSGNPKPFYSTGSVLTGLQDQGQLSPVEASRFMRDWAGQGAAMSPQTDMQQDIRNAAYSLWRHSQGNPLTAESWLAEGGNVPGLRMIGSTHPRLSEQMFSGTVDPWKNPKPFTFREAWSGNMSDIVADNHYITAILDAYDQLNPGGLPRGWFQDQSAFDRYTAEGGFPKTGPLPDKMIDPSLAGSMIGGREAQTEYPVMQAPGYKAAEKLGISPSEVQERMWFDFGPRTGLRSPEMMIPDMLNSQLEETAKATGVPVETLLRLFAKRQIPLAENQPLNVPGESAVG
jgi:hypothetical protein